MTKLFGCIPNKEININNKSAYNLGYMFAKRGSPRIAIGMFGKDALKGYDKYIEELVIENE